MKKKTPKHYPPDWPQIAYAVKIRDHYTCQHCGLQFGPAVKRKRDSNGKYQTLGVHHKDRKPWNCADENLITLCSACHCRAEWPLIRAEMLEKHNNSNQQELKFDV